MIRSIDYLINKPIHAIDGTIGKVDDFLVDEHNHQVTHLVGDIGQWPTSEKVVISNREFQQMVPRGDVPSFPVRMLSDQVAKAPAYDSGVVVSAGPGEQTHGQSYWTSPYEHGAVSRFVGDEAPEAYGRSFGREPDERPVMSIRETVGLSIEAMGSAFGCVSDFLMNDSNWKLQYLVIDSNRWLPGSIKYCVHMKRIGQIDLEGNVVHLKMSRSQIEELPEYEPDEVLF